jgi:hypothetical protein
MNTRRIQRSEESETSKVYRQVFFYVKGIEDTQL